MKAGLISDTHSGRVNYIPRVIQDNFEGVDIIFHAGDIGDLSYLSKLGEIAQVEAVAGNVDSDVIGDIVGYHKVVNFAGKRIGLTHGHLGNSKTTVERVLKAFDGVDIIIFGHSHEPFFEEINGVYMINPGAVSRPRSKNRRPSIGLLEIINGEISFEIIYL